jgi:hypothetical protein
MNTAGLNQYLVRLSIPIEIPLLPTTTMVTAAVAHKTRARPS